MIELRRLLADIDVRIVAAEDRLDVPVRWVHISELADPTPWLAGGELLLTTGMGVGEEPGAYVARLAEHGVAALGVGVATGAGLDELPAAMIEVARDRGFPLFEVPYEVPFLAITEKAFTHIVNEQYAVMQRAISAHERLEQIVLSERGLPAVVAALAALVEGGALVLDARGDVLACEGMPDAAVEAARKELSSRFGAERPAPADVLDGDGLALPVARAGGDGRVQAWLVGAKGAGALGDFDRLVLHQAVTIVALELLRRRVAGDTERRLAGDVLASLLAGELEGAELERRLAPFGLGGRVAALVLAPERSVREAVEEALHEALRSEAGGGLAASAGNVTCGLFPAPADDETLFAVAERVRARVSRETRSALPAGAGRAVAAGDVRRAFHEARCALEALQLGAGGRENGRAALATYRDLGSFQLLLSLQDDDALRVFCDSILGPIDAGEGAYGGELMRSLEVFIECNGQWERAARQLFCHRHTLRYRIRRVEELTGRSLDSARDRIDFWLALRGRELITEN